MVEKVTMNWNEVEMSFRGEFVTTSGFLEVMLEVLKGPIGVDMVEKVLRIWNHVEMSINGEIITTSGFAEVILEVLKGPIGVGMVERWLGFEMLNKCQLLAKLLLLPFLRKSFWRS